MSYEYVAGLGLDEAMDRVWTALTEAGPDGMSKAALCDHCAMGRRQVTRALNGIRRLYMEDRSQPLAYLRRADRYVLSTSWVEDQRPHLVTERLKRIKSETENAQREINAAWAKWPEFRREIRAVQKDLDRFTVDAADLLDVLTAA